MASSYSSFLGIYWLALLSAAEFFRGVAAQRRHAKFRPSAQTATQSESSATARSRERPTSAELFASRSSLKQALAGPSITFPGRTTSLAADATLLQRFAHHLPEMSPRIVVAVGQVCGAARFVAAFVGGWSRLCPPWDSMKNITKVNGAGSPLGKRSLHYYGHMLFTSRSSKNRHTAGLAADSAGQAPEDSIGQSFKFLGRILGYSNLILQPTSSLHAHTTSFDFGLVADRQMRRIPLLQDITLRRRIFLGSGTMLESNSGCLRKAAS
jgi:hypothetical protein